MRTLDCTRIWLFFGGFLIALLVYGSLVPNGQNALFNIGWRIIPAVGLIEPDKMHHLFVYGVLVLWFAQVVRSGLRTRLAVSLFLLGLLLECLQGLSGYREFDLRDISANTLGILTGFYCAKTRLGSILRSWDRTLSAPIPFFSA